MAKLLKFSDEAKIAIEKGVDVLTNAVKVTLGPKGRNVVLEKEYASPLITNDGVTIAKEIELPDEFENIGAQLVKEAAIKTNDVAGDGTTTATILAGSMIKSGLRYVRNSANPVMLKRGISKAVLLVADEIKKMATPVKGKEDIAKIAAIMICFFSIFLILSFLENFKTDIITSQLINITLFISVLNKIFNTY